MSKGSALKFAQASFLGCAVAYATSSLWLLIACVVVGLVMAQTAMDRVESDDRGARLVFGDRVLRQLGRPFDKKG